MPLPATVAILAAPAHAGTVAFLLDGASGVMIVTVWENRTFRFGWPREWNGMSYAVLSPGMVMPLVVEDQSRLPVMKYHGKLSPLADMLRKAFEKAGITDKLLDRSIRKSHAGT